MPRSTRSPSVEIQHVQPVAGNKRRRPSTATASPRPGSRRSTRRATAAAAPPPTTIILDSSDTDELFVSRPTKHIRVESETDEDPFPNDHPQRDVAAKPPSPVVAPAPEPVAAKNANRIEFAAFQCAICMDNATNLAVTHCGHMFCSECLQSALTTETTRNKCPICRQKVETRERDTYNAKTKGFWHLELKPMTANKKGKQAAK